MGKNAFVPMEEVMAAESSTVMMSSDGISVHMRIPAERSYLHNALLTLREICDHLDLNAENTFRIILPLEETLLNVMEHAYLEALGLIDLQFAVDGRELVVVVEDFGVGLPNEVQEMDLDRLEVLRARGRGLAIVKGFPDKTLVQSTNGRGTRATMIFNLPDSEVS